MSDLALKKLERIIHAAYAALICLAVWLVLRYGLRLILPFLLALPLVAALNPLIKWIHRRLPINKKLVSVLIVAVLYVCIFGLIFLIGTRLWMLTRQAISLLPGFLEGKLVPALSSLLTLFNGLLDELPPGWGLEIASIQDNLIGAARSMALSVSQWGVNAVSSMTNAVPAFFMNLMVTVILSFLISIQYDDVIRFLKAQLSGGALRMLDAFAGISKVTVLHYLRALAIMMLVTFAELAVGLFVLGVGNPLWMAALIALVDALPVFGTGGIMLPWMVVELVQRNASMAAGLLVLYLIVTVVRRAIEPAVVGDLLGINPIVSLLSIYVGYRTTGVFGMITFPILTQILLSMHQRGLLRLYRSPDPSFETPGDEQRPDAPAGEGEAV